MIWYFNNFFRSCDDLLRFILSKKHLKIDFFLPELKKCFVFVKYLYFIASSTLIIIKQIYIWYIHACRVWLSVNIKWVISKTNGFFSSYRYLSYGQKAYLLKYKSSVVARRTENGCNCDVRLGNDFQTRPKSGRRENEILHSWRALSQFLERDLNDDRYTRDRSYSLVNVACD